MGYEAHGGVKHEETLGKAIDQLKKDLANLEKRVKKLEEG